MAISEYELQSQLDDLSEQPDLRLTGQSPVLGEAVSIVPAVEEPLTVLRSVEPLEDFKTLLHGHIRGGDYDHKNTEELLEIREGIQAVRDSLSSRYAELAKLEATLQQEMTWTNGYLIDLNKAIAEKQKDQPLKHRDV
jgi:hypothetical protein